MIRSLLISLALATAVVAGPALAQSDDKKRETKVTEKLSPQVYERILEAQTALDEKRLNDAEATLDKLVADRKDKLNDYEQGQIYNFYAAIHYEQGKTQETIRDYQQIVRLEKVPEGLKNNALFRLAQLYFVEEDYDKSIRMLDTWMQRVESVQPEAHMLKAQAFYQMEDYQGSIQPALDAFKEARKRKTPPKESWFALLRAAYYEVGDYDKAAKLLIILIKRFPKEAYYKQLAGMLGLMESQKGQLTLMHAAYEAGMLKTESELLNTARLYMAEDAPYAAIELMKREMRAKRIEPNADNLQLLAQAMALGKEYEQQVPVLERAAELSGEAKQFLYLGQAQMALYRWADAAKSLDRAVQIGGLDRLGNIHMQIGTAYYNIKRFSQARRAFRAAANYPDTAQKASQWVRFVDKEVERERAIAG